MTDATLSTLLATQAIRDVLSRYCRGLDRMDRDLARSVWHDDGTADYHGMYHGSGHGFIDWVWQAHAAMERHSHQITNVLVTLAGDRAHSESYVTVALWTLPDAGGKQQEIIARARYLDRWSHRAGRWALDHRTCVVDTQTIMPLSRGEVSSRSRRDRDDASYRDIDLR